MFQKYRNLELAVFAAYFQQMVFLDCGRFEIWKLHVYKVYQTLLSRNIKENVFS